MFRSRFLAATFVVLLAGCAVPGAERGEPAARPHRETITTFQIEGRIAVRHGAESFTAGIDWRHAVGSEEIFVSGPAGQGLARLSASASGALLETAEQKRFEAQDLDGLTEQVFGARLPVAGMARWVLGRSAFGGVTTVDESGRMAHLSEAGWAIEYLRYESESADALPVLLQARRGDVEVRLKIDSWSMAR